jgi:hypothetical protein
MGEFLELFRNALQPRQSTDLFSQPPPEELSNGASLSSFSLSEGHSPGGGYHRSWSVNYDSSTVLPPERRRMPQRAPNALVGSSGASSTILSGADAALTHLNQNAGSQVHFAGLSSAEAEDLKSALGPRCGVRMRLRPDRRGHDLVVYRAEGADQPIAGIVDGNGGFIPDPYAQPGYFNDDWGHSFSEPQGDGSRDLYMWRKT